MIETMNEGAITLASDGTILFCKQRFADIIKGALEKVMGSSIYQYISSKDLQLFEALVKRGVKGYSNVELVLQTNSENIVPVFLAASSLQLADMHDAVCIVVTDLTEQKRNEAMLTGAQVTDQILNQTEEIFVLCDNQGRIIRANQSTNRLLGGSPLFQTFDEALRLLYPDGTPFVLLSAMSDKVLRAVEVLFTHGDKGSFSFLLSAKPLTTDKGVIGIVVVIVNITEHKKKDKALKKPMTSSNGRWRSGRVNFGRLSRRSKQ
ncbi:MAG: PAS domain-containing protein [Syntrophales bacterium]